MDHDHKIDGTIRCLNASRVFDVLDRVNTIAPGDIHITTTFEELPAFAGWVRASVVITITGADQLAPALRAELQSVLADLDPYRVDPRPVESAT